MDKIYLGINVSHGASMNIKMNMALSNLEFVKNLYVAATGTDDSLSIGACYYLNRKNKNKPLKNMYFGQKVFEKKVSKKYIKKIFKNKDNILIKDNIGPKKIAQLINRGEIIAIARDREEFGARALGNRSIIAHPGYDGIFQRINKQIKNRDFWMPFALTVLKKNIKILLKTKKILNLNL